VESRGGRVLPAPLRREGLKVETGPNVR